MKLFCLSGYRVCSLLGCEVWSPLGHGIFFAVDNFCKLLSCYELVAIRLCNYVVVLRVRFNLGHGKVLMMEFEKFGC